jgi:hypothetical protein
MEYRKTASLVEKLIVKLPSFFVEVETLQAPSDNFTVAKASGRN